MVAPSLASVRTARGVEEIDTTLVDPLDPGALVLIHGGVAITRVEAPVARGRAMTERTDFLYPFIEGDERDPGPLLVDLAAFRAGEA